MGAGKLGKMFRPGIRSQPAFLAQQRTCNMYLPRQYIPPPNNFFLIKKASSESAKCLKGKVQ